MRRMACKFVVGCLTLLSLLTLCSCGRLKEPSEVVSHVSNILPEAVLRNQAETVDEEGYKTREYTFEINEITFEVDNYQYEESLFGTTAAGVTNNYANALYERYKTQIESIAAKYGVEISCGYGFQIEYKLPSFADSVCGINALQELYSLIEEYIPKTNPEWFDFSLELMTYTDEKNFYTILTNRADTDFEYEEKLLKLDVAHALRQGKITSFSYTEEELSDIPIKELNLLYINGKQVVSERYPISFIYNVKDGKYYTTVCYGTKLDYNGGVEDYLQREIIQVYYPDSQYKISDESTTYKIGKVHYRIDKKEDGLFFYRQGRKLDIAVYEEIDGMSPGATYYYWMDIDSFASLMGMQVEGVTRDAVYLVQE